MARLAQQAQQGPAPVTQAPAAPKTSIPIGIVAPAQPSSAAWGRWRDHAGCESKTRPFPRPSPVTRWVCHPLRHRPRRNHGHLDAVASGSAHGRRRCRDAARRLRRSLAGPCRGFESRPGPAAVLHQAELAPLPPARQRRVVVGPAVGARPGRWRIGDRRRPLLRVGRRARRPPSAATPWPQRSTAGSGCTSTASIVHPDTSPAFELETLDYNDGSVMVPGYDQLATPGGSVDLCAQVRDSATGTYTYSWNTTGLTDATSISGSSTYDLTFQWDTTIATATAESVTLTVTDPEPERGQPDLHLLGAGRHRLGDRRHDLEQLDARPRPAPGRRAGLRQPERLGRRGHRRARDVDQPAQLQPEYPGVCRSITTRWRPNALPIIVAEHRARPDASTPSQVSAQLTFDGTAGSTYYYDTSALAARRHHADRPPGQRHQRSTPAVIPTR